MHTNFITRLDLMRPCTISRIHAVLDAQPTAHFQQDPPRAVLFVFISTISSAHRVTAAPHFFQAIGICGVWGH